MVSEDHATVLRQPPLQICGCQNNIYMKMLSLGPIYNHTMLQYLTNGLFPFLRANLHNYLYMVVFVVYQSLESLFFNLVHLDLPGYHGVWP